MMSTYNLCDVIAIAKSHPFYCKSVQYPPDPEAISKILSSADHTNGLDFESLPLISKHDLYQTIRRLIDDASIKNTYRLSSYMSITGGGSGGLLMPFATDVQENRKQRASIGSLLKATGVIEPGDWVLTMHTSGNFYRSLDLIAEIVENAGGTVLCAGTMPLPNVVNAIAQYHVNVLSGDGSQIGQFAYYLSSIPPDQRPNINLTKIVYTSEPLNHTGRALITSVLGPVQICSILASAEAGPWAVANPTLTGESSDNMAEFVYDTRTMILEIFPPSILGKSPLSEEVITKEPNDLTDEIGIIVQTSLQRLRNPLVRYITGDRGSVHPLPEGARASIPPEYADHLKILRLYGRDPRFSFKWLGEYYEFDKLHTWMQTKAWSILQWQIILRRVQNSPEVLLEIRLLRTVVDRQELPDSEIIEALREFFIIHSMNEYLFKTTFIQNFQDFERSLTGNKVIKFIDKS